MPDLVRGETFADGETVTAERLHRLVDNATITDGAIGTNELANGAVTTEKLATGAELPAGSIQLASGRLLVGNAQGKAAPMTPSAEFTADAANGFALASKGVTAAKIADGAVGTGQLATLAPSPAGEWGDAVNVPVLTVDDTGRVTAAREVSVQAPGLVVSEILTQKPVVWSPGAIAAWTHTLGQVPTSFLVWLVCVLDTVDTGNPSTEPNFKVGDIIPLWCCFFKSGDETWPAFSVFANATRVEVTAYGQGEVQVMARTTAVPVSIQNMLNNFRFAGSVMKVT